MILFPYIPCIKHAYHIKTQEYHRLDVIMCKAIKRVAKELKKFKEDPPPFVRAVHMDESTSKDFHFLIDGPNNTSHEGGQFVLAMVIPDEYPFCPPKFKMLTPNGRFQQNDWICISGVSSHHSYDWSCSQNFGSVLVSIVSFMIDENPGLHAGMEQSSDDEKKRLASTSRAYNTRNKYDDMFTEVLI